MAAKKTTTRARKPAKAKATKKTSVRSSRKAPAVMKGSSYWVGPGQQVGGTAPDPIGID